jgi:hypothetical protein
MVEVVKATKDSTEPWVGDLMDGHEAVLRKFRQCNRMSTPHALGWKGATLKYWPLIAESYELVLFNLERLLKEVDEALADNDVWSTTCSMARLGRSMSMSRCATDAKVTLESRAVKFDKKVQARWFKSTEESGKVKTGRDVVMPLTNVRKRTAGKFKRPNFEGWAD